MEGKELIRATIPFMEEDRFKSWYHLAITIVLLAIVWGGSLLQSPFVFRLILSILTGLTLCRLFVINHDYQHGAILQKSWLAKTIFKLVGWVCLAPDSVWKETHSHHHKHNSKFSWIVIGSFPIVSKEAYLKASPLLRIKYKILRHPLMILFAYLPVFVISFCLLPFFENPRKYYDCAISFFVHFALGFLLFTLGGMSVLIFSFLLPFALVFMLGSYIFYAQHNFKKVQFQDNESWDYVKAALKSSSYIKMHPVMRWFTANIGYHHIHHINERIPFYRLQEVMESFPEFQNPGTTSLHPVEIWHCLQLKLWDAKAKRMIRWRDLYPL